MDTQLYIGFERGEIFTANIHDSKSQTSGEVQSQVRLHNAEPDIRIRAIAAKTLTA